MVSPSPTSANTATTGVLLVLAPFEESAKRVESHLRNAGHRMRALWVTTLAELEQQLQRQPPDLLLASDHAESPPLAAVIECALRFAPSLPVLALANQLGGERLLRAVAAGARDLVCDADPDSLQHLQRVCLREFASYRQLRELTRTRAQLADYEARYKQLLTGTGDAVVHLYEGILSQANPAFASLLGYADPAELDGTPLMDVVAPDHQTAVKDLLRQLNNGKLSEQSLECSLLGKDGARVGVSAQLTRGEAAGERFIEMLIRARSAQPQALPSATEPGRRAFYAALATAPEDPQPRACLFAVVDGFAGLEDRVGYDDAELLLEQVRTALAAPLQGRDALFRFSTQEFGLLLTRPDAQAFEALAQRLGGELGRRVFSTPDHDAQLSLSITVYPLAGDENLEQVIAESVREARQLSSLGGGNTVRVLGPTARASAEEHEDIQRAESLRLAIEQNRLKLAYQTIASLEGESAQHFDVLVRMINEQGEEIHASAFIRTAEKHGLMRAIDRWVMSRALRVIASREAKTGGSMLFVKMSEDTLRDAESFFPWLNEALKGRRLPEAELCFEIQERVLQNHIRKAKVLTKALRDLGASVAIDHFGIGTNSAQLIEHLPINFLKFHSSFTQGFAEKDVQAKMATLMDLARQKQVKTIVSHVEDANVMARMWQMGVNYIQGYHVQEPEVVLLADELPRK